MIFYNYFLYNRLAHNSIFTDRQGERFVIPNRVESTKNFTKNITEYHLIFKIETCRKRLHWKSILHIQLNFIIIQQKSLTTYYPSPTLLSVVQKSNSSTSHLIFEVYVSHTIRRTPCRTFLTGDQPDAEAATYTKHNKHKVRISIYSASFEPATPANKRS